MRLLLVLLLSSCAISLSAPSPSTMTPATRFGTDRLALLSFKSLVYEDPSGALASWNNQSLHFCRWRGVTCHNRSHELRVTALDLESLGLAGSISPSLANLTFLQRLHLPNNQLRGPIPQELGFLSHLQHLNLTDNPLGGMIPISLFHNCSHLRNLSLNSNNINGPLPRNLSRCLQLQLIALRNNMLEGEIPSELGSLSKLKALSLWNNRLGGSIPAAIGNLTSLTYLDLSYNYLAGAIPSEIVKLAHLPILYLNDNQLTGTIPAAIWNLTSVMYLDLSYNDLVGAISSEIANLARLTILYLDDNQLTGAIPTATWNLTSLTQVDFSSNHLVGAIPSEIGNLERLSKLSLSNNQFTGAIPLTVWNISSFEQLDLSYNQFAGAIPSEIGNLANLNAIRLASNLLSATIPSTLGGLPSLQRIYLGENLFLGEISTTLGNLSQLSTLDLSSNQLHGPIPPSIGNCSLEYLDLSLNKLNGTVPKEILSIPTLTKLLNVSDNMLIGSLPSEVGNLKNIQAFDISNNRLSGEIPSTIGECEVLQYLYMEGNSFHGSIPPSVSQLKGLQDLDLSHNSLTGNIPEFLTQLSFLSYLNLSFNNFEGKVPKDGVFHNTSAFSVVGNGKLCGGVQRLNLPPCPNQSSKKTHLSRKLIAIISAVAGTMCLILLLSLFVTLCWIRKSKKEPHSMTCIGDRHKKVSYAELMRATNGFSPANLIGVGSFGSVYKGFMNYDDEYDVVAVKVLNLQQRGSSRSFIAECEALRSTRHRNLVKILTACASIDFRGNDFKALVYQFLPNGNLDRWLHPEADEQGGRTLSLAQRMNILMDVASALDYLHHHSLEPIVHCDIKPSNILLDNDMAAHVGDFGLAKFLSRVPIEAQNSSSSMILKGSIGYVAPEYGVANKASTEGDVYSYGILVLEMFTGKRPTDETFDHDLSLPQYVEMALLEQVMEVLDANLHIKEEEGDGQPEVIDGMSARAMECITSMLRMGIKCTKELPAERMLLRDVINELTTIRRIYFEHRR